MERSECKKENVFSPMNSSSITRYFKTKKCLFESPKPMEVDSPKFKTPSPWQKSSPNTSPSDDSPFFLFKIKKKDQASSTFLERAATCLDFSSTTPTHKKFVLTERNEKNDITSSCDSFLIDSPSVVKLAVQKSIQNPDLIGDFSKPCVLPVIQGKHPDLTTVTSETIASMLSGGESCKFTIIDCRYPYEYEGGHIQGAKNIYLKEDIAAEFLTSSDMLQKSNSRNVIIFYCEFSSERAPNMFRHLRKKDRDMNKDCYPFLYYPEIYLIEGGYKAFFSNFRGLCTPADYTTMLDKDYAKELAFYRTQCKASLRLAKRRRSFLK